MLDEHRSGLGAADLRAHSGVHRIGLSTLGLRIAIEGGRPETILTWAEYGRASHLLLPSLLPPDDDELAIHLADLRLTVADVNAAVTEGRDSAVAVGRQLAAERRVRDLSRRRPGVVGPSMTPIGLSLLSSALGSRALVEYVELDGEMFALAIADGLAHWRALGPIEPLRALIDRLSFALHRLAAGANDPAAIRRLMRDATARLDALLLAPLGRCSRRPTADHRARPARCSLCPGRHFPPAPSARSQSHPRPPPGTRRPLPLRRPDAWWSSQDRGSPAPRGRPIDRADVRGPALSGPAATVGAVQGALAGADVAHLATHGRVHPEHPLFSSLQLTDGPMTGYDLEQLRPVPRLVVLAGCNTGRDAVVAGEELLGLTATLLARGARQVIATVVPIPDTDTEPVMTAFHAQLLAGESAASALALAQAAAEGGAQAAAAAGFVCIGGGFSLPPAAGHGHGGCGD